MERVPRHDEQLGDGSDVISNKIFTADVRQRIDLWSAKLLSLPQYRPPRGRFPGGVLRLGQAGTFLLFKSGKVVVNGLRTEPDELEFHLRTDLLLDNVKLSHCSGYLTVGRHLRLSELQRQIAGSIYEPDLHPALTFKIDNVSVMIHHTGKVLFCGCRTVAHAYNVKRNIMKLISM